MIRKHLSMLSLLGIIGAISSFENVVAGVDADSVFINGKIHIDDAEHQPATAIAVKGRSIVYVGNDPSALIGSGTKVYDLSERLVIPGIIDAHSHPGFVGFSVDQFVLKEIQTKQQLIYEYLPSSQAV